MPGDAAILLKIPRSILLLAALSPLIFAQSVISQTMPGEAATPAVAASSAVEMGRQLDAKAVVLRVQPAVGARYRVKQFSRVETQLPKTVSSPGGTSTTIVKATLDMEMTGRDALGGTAMKLTYKFQNIPDGGKPINNHAKTGRGCTSQANLGDALTTWRN